MEQHETYEPPAIAEVGEFTVLTCGMSPGSYFDYMGAYPYYLAVGG
ncbi:lasso RiPP family leader peptide-containing protein [Streptomyces sp. AV19]|nr:lasso RiPP family leader peptide-containing protein [Streptomyces sp. AV19]MBH1937423.1 lasso RiPP family leader peptide-containing protein [Streptomyces sp. AV19]MDG4533804.1 lasso RiPP family leader peptide-containing protein [Streptomyces sp. AV19]